jgi:hypothetical protein
MDLDLIVAEEPIHEGKILVACKIIDNLVDERVWKVVFGKSMVEIMKVSVDMNSAWIFLTGIGLETHEVYSMG